MSKTTYTTDVANNKMIVKRTFDAPLPLVWKAWTDSTILDQWWAPKPWKTKTKHMDFSEGGYWLYNMNGPDGEQHWARADYSRIVIERSYEADDAFCDADGNKTGDFPTLHWVVEFTRVSNATQVVIHIAFPSEEAIDRIIEMGFKEGFSSAHDNLDAVLAKVKV